MPFSIIDHVIGGLGPITSIDAGITPPNSSTVIPTPPLRPGMIVRAVDTTYGEGEFILLKGVASTAVGSLVRYNATDFSTTLVVNTASQAVSVAVAMSANTSSSQWGWYQISGQAVVAKIGDAFPSANVAIYLSATAGAVSVTQGNGLQVVGCRTAATALAGDATVKVMMSRPHLQSQIV